MEAQIINQNKEALSAYGKFKYDKARRLFEKNVAEYPCLITLNNLAWYYFHEEGMLKESKRIIEKAIARKPRSSFPFAILGDISMEENRLNRAIQLYHKALKYGDTPLTIRHNLGLSYYLTGNFTYATIFFSHAASMTEKHSNQMHSRYCLFICLWNQGLKELLKLRLTQPSFYLEDEDLLLAQLYFGLDEYTKAYEYFELAFSQYQKEPAWISQYLYSLNMLKEHDKSARVLTITIDEAKQDLSELSLELLELLKTISPTKEDSEKILYLKQEILLTKKLLEKYNNMNQITSKPVLQLDLSVNEDHLRDCYLFGCEEHENPFPIEPSCY